MVVFVRMVVDGRGPETYVHRNWGNQSYVLSFVSRALTLITNLTMLEIQPLFTD